MNLLGNQLGTRYLFKRHTFGLARRGVISAKNRVLQKLIQLPLEEVVKLLREISPPHMLHESLFVLGIDRPDQALKKGLAHTDSLFRLPVVTQAPGSLTGGMECLQLQATLFRDADCAIHVEQLLMGVLEAALAVSQSYPVQLMLADPTPVLRIKR